MVKHKIRFFRNTETGEASGACTCGRAASGTLEEVQKWASSHDLDHLPDIPEKVPFKSGLPEDNR